MKISDNFFKKIEKKTSVDKDTILKLADKLKGDNMKNEEALKDVIESISVLTGKSIPKEKQDKIIDTILADKAPSKLEDLDKFVK